LNIQLDNSQKFGKLRGFLWPIHSYEHKKLIPMFCLFFLISFAYNVLRCMKVTLVVTAEGSGAEIIPFLKVWAVLPGAVLLTFIYTFLSNRLSREHVFYTMLGIFLGFFALFMMVLHPNREALELTTLSNILQSKLPEGFKGLVSIIRHWPLSLFYVLGEMWSAIVLSMLFWGFANEITSVDEAKRFYAIFALGANSSGIFSGQCAKFLTLDHYNPAFPFGKVAWEQSLILQISVVLFLGLLIMMLYRYVNRRMETLEVTSGGHNKAQKNIDFLEENKKEKLSLSECFTQLIRSPYMLSIAILVIAYNIVYNLSDVLWTEQVKQHYPDAGEFNAYINQIATYTGIFATFSALILSGNVIRRYGWTMTALITPILWFVTGIGFLGCLLFSSNLHFTEVMAGLFGMPVYSLALIFGSSQICLGRAAKYTVFDESKEIAFIPLSKEQQRKGKAVVDGIASRFGKSGGSLMIQILLIVCGDLMLTIPYIAVIFVVVIGLWMLAVRKLGRLASNTIDKQFHARGDEGTSDVEYYTKTI
jgi:AAA family ATP:ADP antiporter